MAWIHKPAIWIPLSVLVFLILSVLSLWVVARARSLGLLACCPLPVSLQGNSGAGIPGVRPGQPAPALRLVDSFGRAVTRPAPLNPQEVIVCRTRTFSSWQ